MPNSLFEVCLQEIMIAVFIKANIQPNSPKWTTMISWGHASQL